MTLEGSLRLPISVTPSIEEVPKSEQKKRLEVPSGDSPLGATQQESSDEMPLEVSRREESSINPSVSGCG